MGTLTTPTSAPQSVIAAGQLKPQEFIPLLCVSRTPAIRLIAATVGVYFALFFFEHAIITLLISLYSISIILYEINLVCVSFVCAEFGLGDDSWLSHVAPLVGTVSALSRSFRGGHSAPHAAPTSSLTSTSSLRKSTLQRARARPHGAHRH